MFLYKTIKLFVEYKENPSYYELGEMFIEKRITAVETMFFSKRHIIYVKIRHLIHSMLKRVIREDTQKGLASLYRDVINKKSCKFL
jgi:hypothetical protein